MAERTAAVREWQFLGALLDDGKLTAAEYPIERDEKSTAAVIPLEAYERYVLLEAAHSIG
jgi:hypothetical protein